MTAFEHATPVLRSSDYPRSRAFYRDSLGFTVVEEGGEPPRFGIFKRDGAVLFVNAWDGGPPPAPGGWDAYLHVEDVDALCQQMRAAGVTIKREPETTVYGVRECEVSDPDGNVLCFGTDIPGDSKA